MQELNVQYMSIKCHHTVTVITLVLLSVQYSNYCLTTVVFNWYTNYCQNTVELL